MRLFILLSKRKSYTPSSHIFPILPDSGISTQNQNLNQNNESKKSNH